MAWAEAARRARQINSYYQSLNEGGYGDYPPPMVPAEPGKGALTLALEEVATGKLPDQGLVDGRLFEVELVDFLVTHGLIDEYTRRSRPRNAR